MVNTLVLYYSPELIDEAVLQHIKNTTGYTGKAEITYTHKRTLRKVSAEVILTEPVVMAKPKQPVDNVMTCSIEDISVDPSVNVMEVEDHIDLNSISDENLDEYVDESIGFEDLPVHEQGEAMSQPIQGIDYEEDLSNDIDNILSGESEESEKTELDDMENLFN